MEKLQKKLTINALLFVFSGAGVVLLARTRIPLCLSTLRWAYKTNFGVWRVLRARPTVLLGLAFLLLAAVALAAGIRCAGLFLKMVRLTAQSAPPAAESGEGAEKYLRQLDDQLKSGLIDRAEYRALLEKYERMGNQNGR